MEDNIRQNLDLDPEVIKMELKECAHQIQKISNENKRQRQTVFHQPQDYYVFEPPEDHPTSNISMVGGTTLDASPDSVQKMTDMYQKERFYSKKLRGLDIFGSIKTVHPSEYFFVSDWSVNTQLLKIDVNAEERSCSARFVDQCEDQKLFVASQAHLFIPDEQKFMFVGGQDPNTELPVKRAFLHSIVNPADTEMLEDMRLKRQECSLALIETSAAQDQKVLVVGGQSNAQTGEY